MPGVAGALPGSCSSVSGRLAKRQNVVEDEGGFPAVRGFLRQDGQKRRCRSPLFLDAPTAWGRRRSSDRPLPGSREEGRSADLAQEVLWRMGRLTPHPRRTTRMTRSTATRKDTPAAVPSPPVPRAATRPASAMKILDPHAVGTLLEWGQFMGLPRHCLRREARLGRLRTSRRAGKLWATGAWMIEWLDAEKVCRERGPRAASFGGQPPAKTDRDRCHA